MAHEQRIPGIFQSILFCDSWRFVEIRGAQSKLRYFVIKISDGPNIMHPFIFRVGFYSIYPLPSIDSYNCILANSLASFLNWRQILKADLNADKCRGY